MSTSVGRASRSRSRTTQGLAAVCFAVGLLAIMLISCVESLHASGSAEAHHDNYRLDDGPVVFLSRVGALARYREGDQVLFLARQSADAFASSRGEILTLVDGGSRLRIDPERTDAPG